jgi:3-dehydrosphinganine reductase
VKRNNIVIGRDRIALITGGSSGIGLAIARLLAQQGSHVWIVARRADQLSTALAEIKAARQSGDQLCGSVSADVSDPDQVLAVAERIVSEVGSPHLVINSAGVARPGYIQELSLGDFRWMMDINFFGTVNTVKAILPGMIARGWGHIVNISSVAGFLGVFGYSAYSASKFAVTGFSEVLRAELKPKGIRVSIVFPPDVDTPQLAYESQFRPAETRALVDGGPILSPEAVATAILQGVDRKQFIILPGTFGKTIFFLTHILGRTRDPIMDWMVSRSLRHPIEKD